MHVDAEHGRAAVPCDGARRCVRPPPPQRAAYAMQSWRMPWAWLVLSAHRARQAVLAGCACVAGAGALRAHLLHK